MPKRSRPVAVVPPAFYAGGDGPPMVLLHGFTDTWQGWRPVLPLLERHHAVFAPTLPGHFGGESFDADHPMTIPDSLDRIERQLDARGIKQAHLVGSSLGGWAALELAARGRALSVVAVCPAGGWEIGSREDRAVIRFFRANTRMMGPSRAVWPLIARRPMLRRIAFRDFMAHPERVDAASAIALMEGAAGCAITQQALDIAARGEAYGELGPIDCPVRILYGTRDRIIRWPSYYVRLRRLLPDAEYIPLDGLGHLPMWDDPELVARRILEVTAGVEAV
jgi:pimeloyl-ACP methyl ester carboxylesterase